MRNVLRVLAAVLLVVPLFAADPPRLAVWRAAELTQRGTELAKHAGPDHSSRETLADFGRHRFRLLYRDADGAPEQHDQIVDVVIVQSGESTLVVGGTMTGKRASGGAGEFLGTRLDGGERRQIAAGDIVHIPAGIPHAFLVAPGKHVAYVLVKFPAE
jgi:mannose-6-phosphate isomerase-like protein (cupin superfamily)